MFNLSLLMLSLVDIPVLPEMQHRYTTTLQNAVTKWKLVKKIDTNSWNCENSFPQRGSNVGILKWLEIARQSVTPAIEEASSYLSGTMNSQNQEYLLPVLVATKPPRCAAAMPSKDEVYDQLAYVHLLKKQKIEAGVMIPVEHVTDAEEESFRVCSFINPSSIVISFASFYCSQ